MSEQKFSKLKKPTVKTASYSRWYLLFLAGIVVATFLTYLPALQNGFLHWDDDKYLQNNPLIYSFDLKKIFSTYVWCNYHPLTILLYSLEYHLFGLNAKAFHAVNIVLHLLNTVLVYYVVLGLTSNLFLKKKNKESLSIQVALVSCLLFGIHPLHVESVAWIAELKDLLYAFFFLFSLISYFQFIRSGERKFYFYTLLLFVLSLLSKAMAASLPVVLVLTDYFMGRKINGKTLLEKVPFFILSFVFGVVAIWAQKSGDAISDIAVFSFLQRIAFACYGFVMYLVKLVLPLHLSAYYPYPIKSGESLPAYYYAFVLIIFVLLYSMWRLKSFYTLKWRTVFFGVAFFTITIFLVLQLLPVGGAIMADRYSYIPSIGIFLIAAVFLTVNLSLKENGGRTALTIALFAITIIFFSATTYTRCGVWKEDMTLWNDVINKYQNVPVAYSNRGILLNDRKRYDEGLSDYNKAIELDPYFADAYLNRGILLVNQKKTEEALKDYNKAIEIRPNYSEAYVFRGNLLTDEKRNKEALSDYDKAIELQPNYAPTYNNRAILLESEKRYDEALRDYDRSIALRPNLAESYYNRGIILMNQKKYQQSMADYNEAIRLKPDLAAAYYYRALIEYNVEGTGGKEAACADLKQAADLGYQPAANALPQICR